MFLSYWLYFNPLENVIANLVSIIKKSGLPVLRLLMKGEDSVENVKIMWQNYYLFVIQLNFITANAEKGFYEKLLLWST